MSNKINGLYKFGEFRFDGERLKLWQNDEQILLSPKACELLKLLLEQSGKCVSKDEILETVWANTFVEDGVLTQNIYTLRKILGHNGNGESIIETKPRLGYRITVPVVRDDEEPKIENGELKSDAENTSHASDPSPSPRRRPVALTLIAAALILVGGFFVWHYFHQTIAAFFRKPIETVRFTKLTNTGDLSGAALSPDGNFLAFIREDKVYLKDIASNKEIPLEIPNVPSFTSLQFSADGNFIYFSNNKALGGQSKILKVSRFGGDTELVVEQNNGSYSLSPDNKFIAYYVRQFPDPALKLFVKNLETKEKREILELDAAAAFCYGCSPAWSPDGKKLIHIVQTAGNLTSQLFVIDVETGAKEEVKIQKLRRFQQAFWFPDGESFVLSAADGNRFFHLWKVYYPSGDVQPITNGLSSYGKPLISADGKKILTLQTTENSNIFTADANNLNNQKQLTVGNTNNFGQTSLTWATEQNILFSSQLDRDLVENFWLVDTEGHGRRQITDEKQVSPNAPDSDGKVIYFNLFHNQSANISKINADGGDLTEVTNGNEGNRRAPQISPDGNWLYYIFRNKNGGKILRRSIVDQTEELFFESETVQCGLFLAVSPDGKYLACPNWRNRTVNDPDKYNAELAVISTESRTVIKFIPISNIPPNFRFAPDSKGIEFITTLGEGTQIMRQNFDDPEPKPVLMLPKEEIFNFAWSKSGKQLAVARGQQIKDAVLLTDFDK